MTSYKDLLLQREALERQIEELRSSERRNAVDQVHALVAQFELTQNDVFGKRRSALAGRPLEAKYRDPASGATWSGRGKPPRWIADQPRDGFLIR